MEKNRKRALRRHHYRRVKRSIVRRMKAKWAYPFDLKPLHACIFANTRPICSCICCGNPRRNNGDKTRQEVAARLRYEEGLDEHALVERRRPVREGKWCRHW